MIKNEKQKFLYSVIMIIMLSLLVFTCGGGNLIQNKIKGTGAKFNLIHVPTGTFTMADGLQVTISNAYFMAETEVTQELWEAVMKDTKNCAKPGILNGINNSSGFGGEKTPSGETQNKRPVEGVTWFDALEFCNELSDKTGLQDEKVYKFYGEIKRHPDGSIYNADVLPDFKKKGFRLPTEREWMWAAMGADKCDPATGYLKAFAGDTIPASKNINDYVWYGGNSNKGATTNTSHQVGKKKPNELGLYDMSGNVMEWCWEWHNYPTTRVARGGCWYQGKEICAIGYRKGSLTEIRGSQNGFRFVRNE